MKKVVFILVVLLGLQTQASNDKYRLSLRGNPATSIVIGWNQISGSNPTVYYGTTDHGTNYANYPNSKTPDRTVSYKSMNNNFARLTGLQPNTAYYFVIRDSQGTSERFWFKTAPSDNSRLSFIAGGDSRNNRTPRKNANRLVAKLKPHAVLFGGDMTNRDSSREWVEWFDDWQLTIASDKRMFPIIATRGNHEGSNNSVYNLFDTPSSSVYYAITFGNNLIRAYTLNTQISISGSQTTWLKGDLNANPNVIWKMAQYHKPMRPHVAGKSEGNSQYSNWAKLFYDKNVKLVVECDSHTVKTTWPVRPTTASGNDEGFVRDDQKGTVYVGEGCWGAPLRTNNDNKSWTRSSARFNQFKWIFVDTEKIETRTIKVDNASSVSSVSNANVFQIPANLDIWNPSTGSVVTITKSTTGGDTQAPSTPRNLTVSSVTATSVSLSWSAATDNVGVTGYDIYKGSTKVATATGTSTTVSGLTANTSYQFKIKAKDAAGNTSGYSNTVNATTSDSGGSTYCAAKSNNTSDEHISNVKVGTVSKSSGAGTGYSDHTATVFTARKGASVSIEITASWAGRKYSEAYGVWIDYNQDGDFKDSGEKVWTKSATQTSPVSGTFTIPATAKTGKTRARVIMRYNTVPSDCGTFDYGEVEDYTLNISSNGSGGDTQAPSAPTGLTSTNVSSSSVSLNWNASTDNVGVTGYDVYNGNSKVSSVSGTSATVGNLTASTAYQFKVKATDAAGNASGYSNTVSVTTSGSGGGNCSGIPQYVAGTAYSNGEIVQNSGDKYECKVSGWCSSSAAWAYSPGSGQYWSQAWTKIGACTAARTKSASVSLGKKGVSIYPNPFKNNFTVYISQKLDKAHITIYNLQGKLVYRNAQRVVANQLTIHTDQMRSGIYFLEIKDSNGLIRTTKKIHKK
ncbi:T9SS type A sorting domain-containing protein [Aquimarina sp. TRL1]|uniref:fibronectin type III domain-containing protein n=1 Tax=Aquimarina sp. (strain TRL1) TaxID=2736252 RepID=UPI0015883D27|nr:GEVED domain-containing protein [Aquimarina sp. TRL1]QKX06709.1 T9SS type A sorting domain-containing protein [Aquimarina sp. TRL1]